MAGVGAPALYRQFGDKDGLLAAVVEAGFFEYLEGKRAATPSDDPLPIYGPAGMRTPPSRSRIPLTTA